MKASSGLSLIEVIVATAILGIVSLGVATLVVNMNQQFAFANVKTESVYLNMQIESALRNSSSCVNNMTVNAVVIGASETLTQVKLYDSAGVVLTDLVPALNENLPGGSRLQVSGMRLTAPMDETTGPVLLSSTATNRNYAADFVVSVTHTLNATSLKPLKVSGLQIQTDLAGNVTGCRLGSSLICVTGSRNGSTGVNSIAYSDPGFSGNFATVFSVINAGGNWGLICNNGWNMTGCRGSSLVESTSSTNAALTTISNGCQSPNASIAAGGNSTIFLTCCSSQ